jgi:hypothetical protein
MFILQTITFRIIAASFVKEGMHLAVRNKIRAAVMTVDVLVNL